MLMAPYSLSLSNSSPLFPSAQQQPTYSSLYPGIVLRLNWIWRGLTPVMLILSSYKKT